MISWNIVTKEVSLGITLQNRIRRAIAKLEKHLKTFPPDVVHLQIVMEKHKAKALFTTALTLYLPAGVLRTEKTSKDALESVSGAVHALLRELEKLKSKLRREPLWKRVARRAELHDSKARFAASPLPQPVADEAESIRSLLERFYPRLLDYIKRHIHRAELEDESLRGVLDPDAVLNSVAEKALTLTLKKARAGEGVQDCLLLLYTLAAQELRKRTAALRRERAVRGGSKIGREGIPVTETPDQILARKELVATLQTAVRHWPKNEHELFDLYFIEGFESDEIAMMQGRAIAQVEKDLQEMQAKFRGLLTEQAWEGARVASPQPGGAANDIRPKRDFEQK